MKKFFVTMGILVAVVAGNLVISTPAEAAVPIVQDQVVIYEHADYNTEITRRHPASCEAAGDYWNLTLLDKNRISSVLFWVPSGFTRCNRMAVLSISNVWYSVCINKWQWGIPHFGEGWNDATWEIWVGHDPRCPAWNAPRP
jgi:hypothetical protein